MKAIIEMPKGTRNKYEINEGKLQLDRILTMKIPHNYGYIPNTLAGDNDPVDVFVLSDEPIVSFTECDIIPIRIFYCDDNGKEDHKIIATVAKSYFRYDATIKEQIVSYLNSYKPGFHIIGYGEADKANEYIELSSKWDVSLGVK